MSTNSHASQNHAHMRQIIAHGMTARLVNGAWGFGLAPHRFVPFDAVARSMRAIDRLYPASQKNDGGK